MKRLVFALTDLVDGGYGAGTGRGDARSPVFDPAPLVSVTPDPNDARAASCSASTLPDFVPYVVRPGDTLGGLIAGQTSVTVTQLAALNCLDDPDALPVGAVIWLPRLP